MNEAFPVLLSYFFVTKVFDASFKCFVCSNFFLSLILCFFEITSLGGKIGMFFVWKFGLVSTNLDL